MTNVPLRGGGKCPPAVEPAAPQLRPLVWPGAETPPPPGSDHSGPRRSPERETSDGVKFLNILQGLKG